MKKRGISIAAILIAVLFVFTVIAFAYSIYFDYKSGMENARGVFDELADHTIESSSIYPCGSKEFLNAFNSSIKAPSAFEQLKLEVDGIEVYIYPSVPKNTNSIFVKTFSRKILGGDGARIELSANIYTLAPSMIFNRAKIAFIIILAGTLATCILLMYVYLSESETTEKGKKSAPQEESSLEDDIDLPEDETTFEDELNLLDDNDNQEGLSPEQEVFDGETGETYEEPSQEDLDIEDSSEEAIAAAEKKTVAAPAPLNIDVGEKGLFSPTSGFGWEAYLDTRLESELVRAASSEQDLAFAVIKIPGLNSEDEYYPKLCEALLQTFQFKDFIFEYKDQGFSALMQNKDIDSAMEIAETLYTNLVSILSVNGVKPLIGISSRSLRLISADRLKTEAEQAMLHADQNESPIVAFRVNPEKYRQYINNQD